MSILSIRNLVLAGGAYGVYQYAKKNGGFQNAFQQLSGKIREAAGNLDLQNLGNQVKQSLGNARSVSGQEDVGQHGIGSRSSSGLGQRSDLGGGSGGFGSGSGGYGGGGFGGGSSGRH